MPTLSVARRRLAAQDLVRPTSGGVLEAVRRLGAVQAQDYGGAKWALAQRVAGALTDAGVERAHDAGEIVRTHLLRPTWHFVAAEDLRWMLALSAPRVRAAMARVRRQHGLDDVTVGRASEIVARALEGGKHLTRPELMAALQRAGMKAGTNQWTTHLMLTAELDGVVCSGPRRGKQFTYALLDERVPPAAAREREEIDGAAYWSAADAARPRARGTIVNLLPPYDELFIGYRDRAGLLARAPALRARWAPAALTPVLAVDGELVGVWSRVAKARSVVVRPEALVPLTPTERRALAAAVERYGEFLGVATSLG